MKKENIFSILLLASIWKSNPISEFKNNKSPVIRGFVDCDLFL